MESLISQKVLKSRDKDSRRVPFAGVVKKPFKYDSHAHRPPLDSRVLMIYRNNTPPTNYSASVHLIIVGYSARECVLLSLSHGCFVARWLGSVHYTREVLKGVELWMCRAGNIAA